MSFTPGVQIQAIAVVVAVACALPGVFLVLRRMAMMSDAISHAILLGIVVAFLIVRDLSSPWLMLGAAATGVATVALVEVLHSTKRVHEDAAIGLVFPLLFSVGVILIAQFAGKVHLDTDAVLLGELAFAPFDQVMIAGRAAGPRSLWVMGGILLLNLALLLVFYKELKLATFDAALAAALGFAPAVVHYGLMAVVSLTAVGAFDAVGSVLVVALMVAPPAAARLLTDRLSGMLCWSAGLAAAAALAGYRVAMALDASLAGSMAAMAGATFGIVWLVAPERGLLALARRQRRQRLDFAIHTLVVHLHQHGGESRGKAWPWSQSQAERIVAAARQRGLVTGNGAGPRLTEPGRELAEAVLSGWLPSTS